MSEQVHLPKLISDEDGKPLFWRRDDWRKRWLYTDSGEVLHRIESIAWGSESDETSGHGSAVCGLVNSFSIPGIFSRMGAKRCSRCCRKLGIPEGDGAPGNCKDFEEPGCEAPSE